MPFDGLLHETTRRPHHLLAAQAVADLMAAQRLIDEKGKWTKGAYRRNRWFRSGQKHCAVGAMRRVIASDLAYLALRQALPQMGTGRDTVETYNDNIYTKHRDIMALYDRAMASLIHGRVVYGPV